MAIRQTMTSPVVLATALLLLCSASRVPAQEMAVPPPSDPPGASMSADWLLDLPTADNLFAALQTMQPDVVGDEFTGGGLGAGQSLRLGALGSAWTQTAFRLDGVDITDPDGSGTPLFFPDLIFWQRISITTNPRAVDMNAAGPVVSLESRTAGARWSGAIDGSVSPTPFVAASSSTAAPAVARLDDWGHGDAIVGGPIDGGRLRMMAGSEVTRTDQFERTGTVTQPASVTSGFVQVAAAASPHDWWRTFALVQQVRYPLANDIVARPLTASSTDHSVHVQAIWDHVMADGRVRHAWAAYTRRARRADAGMADPFIVDRILNGPVPELVDAGAGVDRRWSAGVELKPAAGVVRSR